MKKLVIGLLATVIMSSCSVQQFAVNTKTEPFQNGGKVWGERVEKCGENGWTSEFRKDKDIHLIGINIRNSNVAAMVEELKASNYTIETKSNLIIYFVTFGIVNCKIVKVIKRDN
jgi:hypothetical protein